MIYILSWWLIVEILGLAALPIAFRFMHWLPERGYTFSKALGLLLASYIVWIGGMSGFLRNDTGGILFAILAVFGLSAIISLRKGFFSEFLIFLKEKKYLILTVEILFIAGFVAWAVLRAYAPDKVMEAGGEKFMEMAFLNGVLNSPRFPPLDPWLSGFAISYYYFGYIMMGFLTRFSAVPTGVGFDLYDALLFGLTVIGIFGILYNLIASHQTIKKRQPYLYGLLGALFVVIMGNLEGLLESLTAKGFISQRFLSWIDIPGLASSPATGAWFPGGGFFGCCWRASRVLQDYDLLKQPVGVSPITEFPMFSFLLGDNHPHVLALPFVILLIALAFNLLVRQSTYAPKQPADVDLTSTSGIQPGKWWNPFDALNGDWKLFLFYGFCLGSLGFLNTWDMPIYLGLLTLAYGTGEYARQRRLDWALALRTIVLAIGLLVSAILFYILFYLGFQSQAGGILPYIFQPTRLPQFLVMFGTLIYLILWFLIISTIQKARSDGKAVVLRSFLAAWGWVLVACVGIIIFFMLVIVLAAGAQIQNPVVQNLLGVGSIGQALQLFAAARLSNPWLFLLLAGILALALVNLIVFGKNGTPANDRSESQTEGDGNLHSAAMDSSPALLPSPSSQFVFLLIIVGIGLTLCVELFYLRDSFGVRMNTVFKFYYQAWVMLGCAGAYAIWWLLNRSMAVLGVVGRGIFLVGAIVLIGAGMIYPLFASYERVDGLRGTPNLDGTINLARANPDDWAAISWLKENATGTPVILEAPGKSYNYDGRISAFSGFPALLGWAYHESQWRGNYDEQGRREPDIQTIYTTKDGSLALSLLQKWNIRYVIVGSSEKTYIEQLCSDPNRACNLTRALLKFDTILIPVFRQGNMAIYEVPTNDKS